MALIKCEECGKEISGSAERCPHCGNKTSYGVKQTQTKVNAVALLIACSFTLLGLYLFFANLGEFLEMYNKWKGIKDWYDISFVEYLFDKEEGSLLWKLVIGGGLMIGGLINVKNLTSQLIPNEHPVKDPSLLTIGPDEWRCHCGRVNKNRIITCECGRKKVEKQTMEIRPDDWKCTCGRINRDYITTCSCGQSKRNIPR